VGREEIRARTPTGDLVGWVDGDGQRVVMLHGGPGLSFNYVDDLGAELVSGYRVASYQQRGLPPSTKAGPFGVANQVRDVGYVLDALGWDKAYVVGHSWGGHLALHTVISLGDRVEGALIVDPLGGFGDGGMAEFETAMAARMPEANKARALELDERAMRGEGTEEDALEGLRMAWPAYFADPPNAPPMPPMSLSVTAYSQTFEDLNVQLPSLEAALPSIRVPVGFVAGGAGPMPVSASTHTAALIPSAWVDIVPGAGHMIWFEAPGACRAGLDRLVAA
jgi:pimeloyl-ACP methyl ester carboxylesterase